jgi:hypothetical protein
MKMRLYAAIVSEETDLPETMLLRGLGKGLEQIKRLEAMVADAWQEITTQRQANTPVFYQAVFLAPEYFFSNARHMQDRFFLHDVKRIIVSRLHALAKSYPHLLVVPGTILWTKDLFDTQKQAVGTGPPQNVKVLNSGRMQNVVARANTAKSTFGTELDQLGWSHTQQNPTWDRKLAQNVAYIFLGDKTLKYHKVGNYKEVDGEADDLLFLPGSIVGRFNVGGVKYGIEICRDHYQGVLESSVGTRGTVHIQLIVSSHIPAKENANASVTLHSSTKAPLRYVEKDNTGHEIGMVTPATNPIRFSGDKVGKLVRNPIKKGSYTLWVIDLDAPDLKNPSDHTLSSSDLSEVAHIY